MITTYENPTLAFCVSAYGWKPHYKAFRIKEYKIRKTQDITVSSLRRLYVLLDKGRVQHSDSSESWFRIYWSIS